MVEFALDQLWQVGKKTGGSSGPASDVADHPFRSGAGKGRGGRGSPGCDDVKPIRQPG